MWHPKPRHGNYMLQLRRSSICSGQTVSRKRTRALQTRRKRMLWPTQRRHHSQPSLRYNNNISRLRLVPAGRWIRRRLLVILLASHPNHFRYPHPPGRPLSKAEINPQLTKTRLTLAAGSPVIPFGERDPKPQKEQD